MTDSQDKSESARLSLKAYGKKANATLQLENELKDLLDITTEDAPDFLQELKQAAWNIVKENPGIDRSDWIDKLIRQYPTEVVDAYGTNSREVYHDLSDLWEMEYTDPRRTSGTVLTVGLNILLQIQTHYKSNWKEQRNG